MAEFGGGLIRAARRVGQYRPVLHADPRGILALIAVAMCWALAVVLYGVGTLFAVPLIAYGILRTHLFDIDLRIRWTIKQSTLAAAVVAIVYLLSEGASRLLSAELGNLAGLLAAALVVFFLAPLQRFAERVASGA